MREVTGSIPVGPQTILSIFTSPVVVLRPLNSISPRLLSTAMLCSSTDGSHHSGSLLAPTSFYTPPPPATSPQMQRDSPYHDLPLLYRSPPTMTSLATRSQFRILQHNQFRILQHNQFRILQHNQSPCPRVSHCTGKRTVSHSLPSALPCKPRYVLQPYPVHRIDLLVYPRARHVTATYKTYVAVAQRASCICHMLVPTRLKGRPIVRLQQYAYKGASPAFCACCHSNQTCLALHAP